MGAILFVAAEEEEFAGFRRHLTTPVRLQWHIDYSVCAEHRGRRILLAANGPGPMLADKAAETARKRECVDAVVSMGSCGGLDPALGPGDIFVASRIVPIGDAEEFTAQTPVTNRSYYSGTLISGDKVIQTVNDKRKLWENGAAAVEMEAAAIARCARSWDVPFYCVRAVTDTAEEGFFVDLNGTRTADGHFSRWKIVAGALRRPGQGVPELARLWRRNRMAASLLGDFLADCEF